MSSKVTKIIDLTRSPSPTSSTPSISTTPKHNTLIVDIDHDTPDINTKRGKRRRQISPILIIENEDAHKPINKRTTNAIRILDNTQIFNQIIQMFPGIQKEYAKEISQQKYTVMDACDHILQQESYPREKKRKMEKIYMVEEENYWTLEGYEGRDNDSQYLDQV